MADAINLTTSTLSEDAKHTLKYVQEYELQSEWIEYEEPTAVLHLHSHYLRDIHPYQEGGIILQFLRSNGIPVSGKVDIEKMVTGRLFWSDFVNLGYRTFYYFKNSPIYKKEATDPSYNICRLVCPICKELCGAVSDHIQLTEDVLPRERQFHGCRHLHKWLDLKEGEQIKYLPVDTTLCSSVQIEITKKDDKPDSDRAITFEDI